jgi:MSHA biogenesis protein MshP
MSRGTGPQKGFSLVSALFLMVILASLGAYLVKLAGVTRTTQMLALQGTRALMAAESGVEWGIHQAFNNTAAACGASASSPVTTSFTLSGTGLEGFAVSVTCRYTQHTEQATAFNVYVVTATASYGSFGGADYVQRTVEAKVSDAPP